MASINSVRGLLKDSKSDLTKILNLLDKKPIDKDQVLKGIKSVQKSMRSVELLIVEQAEEVKEVPILDKTSSKEVLKKEAPKVVGKEEKEEEPAKEAEEDNWGF